MPIPPQDPRWKAAGIVTAVIRKEKGRYCVRSPNNPDWNGGCYDTKGEAEKRLKQVEFFKRQAAARTWKIDRSAVNRMLRALNDPEMAARTRSVHGGYDTYRFELVPIDRIDLPPMWHPGRPGPLRERMLAGKPIDPVRLSPEGGRYGITDGIHRTNVARELGFTHVPALIHEWVDTPEAREAPIPEKPRLPLGAWVRLPRPEGGRSYGWVDEQLGPRNDRGTRRWQYSIALVKDGDDWPDFVDMYDVEFEPVDAPAWGEATKARCTR